MKRLLAVATALLASLVVAPSAWSDAPGDCRLDSCVDTLPDGYRYTYVNGVFYSNFGGSRTGKDAHGHPVEYFFEPACAGNFVDVHGIGTNKICHSAIVACPPGEVLMWIFQRPLGKPVIPRRTGQQCMGAQQTVSLKDAQDAFIRYLRERHLPQPTVSAAPETGGLVNLPQIYWTESNGPVRLQVNQPLPATISAEPHWSWDFGDGAAGPDSPGTPYRPGVYPRDHPDYYLAHAYADTGTVTATVTVTWDANFTVAGIARTFPIPPITLTASRALPIFQARSELVAAAR